MKEVVSVQELQMTYPLSAKQKKKKPIEKNNNNNKKNLSVHVWKYDTWKVRAVGAR